MRDKSSVYQVSPYNPTSLEAKNYPASGRQKMTTAGNLEGQSLICHFPVAIPRGGNTTSDLCDDRANADQTQQVKIKPWIGMGSAPRCNDAH